MSLKTCETCSRPDMCSRAGRCLGDDCPTCEGKRKLYTGWECDVKWIECFDCGGTGKAEIPICAAMREKGGKDD